MADLFQITLSDQIACVEREIRMRERVYPRLVDSGQMRRETAERELAVMRRVSETLNRLFKSEAITDEARAYIAGPR